MKTVAVKISPPKFHQAVFAITGTSPLVICRFSEEAKRSIVDKQEGGKPARSKKKHEAVASTSLFDAARYYGKTGRVTWDGFHASAVRNAMISACRLVGYKMTLAKLSIFVEPDGWDTAEPQIPLIRILGTKARMQQDAVRNNNSGQCTVATRAAYHDWKADVRIRWDADQFTLEDITNLLSRAGAQVGFGCGRPDSKESAGMGWGLFQVEQTK